MTSMNALAIYAVNEHLAELMAEARAARLARQSKPRRGIRARVTSLFSGPGSAGTPSREALAGS
jgi:hypothetical protein